jgi:outer membrane biosynthesis protein TonB
MLGILSNRNRRVLALCLGTLLLFILLLLVSLEDTFEVERPPKITMHEVRIYSPPPPPPPPPMEQNAQDSPMPSLTRANAEDPVKLDFMALEVNMDGIGVSGFGIGAGGPGGSGGLGWGGGAWGTIALSELDNIPMMRSAPLLRSDDDNPLLGWPKEAVDQNISQFVVQLHIAIDEEGRTYPIRIIQNPFPTMNEEILEFVSDVLFTPPTRLGVPVKTDYLWDLLIKRPSRHPL